MPPRGLCGGAGGTGITCGPGTVLVDKECVIATDASDDAADAAADGPPALACTGQCAYYAPQGWSEPELLWVGPAQQQVPGCPVPTPAGFVGFTGVDASCPPCQCNPPTGSCGLPPTIAVSPEPCETADADGGETPFDPPAGWDGGCTANDAIDGGALCDGGPCVQSATIAPLIVKETGCAPVAPTLGATVAFGSSTLSCPALAGGACTMGTCLPTPPPGFAICVSQEGDVACPPPSVPTPYTQQLLVYNNPYVWTCSACACGAPAGSVCSAEISLYSDGMCASPMPNANPVDSTKPICVDLITGAALGSQSASAPVYTPGACQPDGGVPLVLRRRRQRENLLLRRPSSPPTPRPRTAMNGARLVAILAIVNVAAACRSGATGTGGAGTGGFATSCGPGTVLVGNVCMLAPEPDAGEPGDAGPSCTCTPPLPDASWLAAEITWVGPSQDAPPCPANFATADPSAPYPADFAPNGSCEPCTCSAPAGACSLPSTMTANAASCAQNGAATPTRRSTPRAAGTVAATRTNPSLPASSAPAPTASSR